MNTLYYNLVIEVHQNHQNNQNQFFYLKNNYIKEGKKYEQI